jgi:hypothetical protein
VENLNKELEVMKSWNPIPSAILLLIKHFDSDT